MKKKAFEARDPVHPGRLPEHETDLVPELPEAPKSDGWPPECTAFVRHIKECEASNVPVAIIEITCNTTSECKVLPTESFRSVPPTHSMIKMTWLAS